MTERIVQARGLSRRFGDFTAVDTMDLSIEKGTIYGFLGPNGCGKTTTIRMMTGLLTPSAGELDVLGLSLPRDAEKLKRQIGYMTQVFSLYGDLTVRENLQFVARIYGLGHRPGKQRIDELMGIYGLDRIAGQLAGSMSGGQRSNPKYGAEDEFPQSFGPLGDIRRVFNYVRCVRSGVDDATSIPGDDGTVVDDPGSDEPGFGVPGFGGPGFGIPGFGGPGWNGPDLLANSCDGLSAGDVCSLTGSFGTESGICRQGPAGLRCAPETGLRLTFALPRRPGGPGRL